MTTPVAVADLRERARRRFERECRAWAASGDHGATIDVPLHPPSERAALADLPGARSWVDAWRTAERSGPVELAWAMRDWARVGSQEVPQRATIHGANAIAQVAGRSRQWRVLTDRAEELRRLTGDAPEAVSALRSCLGTVAALDDADAARLLAVLAWLRDNPVSDRLVRELPIRGIDTKWIERRRGLVESLHRVITGRAGLGLREPSPLVRLRVLDPALAIGGLTDVSAPVEDLAALPVHPERVFVLENLATLLAMPAVPGAVVLDGGGHRVELVARLPWVRAVTYWGDLDSHGFAILDRLRAHGVAARSVLMDTDTLLDHRDLWGTDPEPMLGTLDHLTPHEQATLQLLSSSGNVRLEQERIPWGYALDRLIPR